MDAERKNNGIKRAKTFLKHLDFSIEKEQVSIDQPEGTIRIDLLASKHGETFAIDVISSSSLRSFANTSFYRAIAKVRAACAIKNWHPLVMLILKEPIRDASRKIPNKFHLYAPEVNWVCLPPDGKPMYIIEGEKQLPGQEKVAEQLNDYEKSERKKSSPEKQKKTLRFSDLELWMLKYVLYSNQLAGEEWNKWNRKKGSRLNEFRRPSRDSNRVYNGNQLAEEADVSLPTVYNWFEALENEGFLHRKKRISIRLQKLNEYVELWTGRYRFRDNENLIQLQFVRKTENPRQKLLDQLRSLPEQRKDRYLLTGHPASKVYGVSVTTAASLQLYRRTDDFQGLRDDLDLIPAEEGPGDVICYRPKFEEAVFRARILLDDFPVVDPLQLYLDCYHLNDRGREQAEAVKEKLLLNFRRSNGSGN